MPKVAILTGGSSGIGRAACLSLKQAGFTVYEFSRRDIPQDGINHVGCDVTDEQAVISAVDTVIEKEGRLDLLVANAGFGISGAVEFTELSEAKAQMDVNFFGSVNCVKACMPHLRASKGRVIGISSVAGPIAIPFQAFYSASKAALNDYYLALANEVRPFGVSVCAVWPGDIKTGFTDARRKENAGDDVYAGRIKKSVAAMEKDEKNGISPEKVGKLIAKLALKKKVKPFYIAGGVYKLLYCVFRLLPYGVSNPIVGKLY